MSHGGYVGVYVLLVYVLPIALVIGAVLAISSSKARAVIVATIAAALWCYSLLIGISLFLFPGPVETLLYGLAVYCAAAGLATAAAVHLMKRARLRANKVR